MTKEKIINIDYDNIKSIKFAEKLKANLENKEYILKSTIQNGLNKFKLIYEKPKNKGIVIYSNKGLSINGVKIFD